MSDEPSADQTSPPYRPRPVLLIFLIMPVLAGIVAFLIGGNGQGQAVSVEITPPVVGFTPFTLVGSMAYDFTLPTPDGQSIRLSGLRGKWVILNFWATWCDPCRSEMPLLQDLVDGKLKQNLPVTVLAVDRDETADTVKAFMRELNLSLPVGIDEGAKINSQYDVIQLPVTYMVDPAGIIRYKHIGALTPDILDQYLAQMSKNG
jgi:peroxiredoxin